MFTQCPECSTVFELTPADLAVAAGMVRCGECRRTFSALKSLAETPAEFESEAALTDKVAAEQSAAGAVAGDAARDVETAENDSEGSDLEAAEDDRDGGDLEAADDVDDVRSAEDAAMADTAARTDAPEDADAVAAVISAATALASQSGPEQAADDDEPNDEAATFAQDEDADSGVLVFGALAGGDYDPADDDDDGDDDDGDDEIVLDEFYQPTGSDDEEPIDDDEHWDFDENAGREAGAGDAAPPVDESALFSLPVPELRAAGIVDPASVPEKLEGGEAAIDPFAQDSSEAMQQAAPDADAEPHRAPLAPTPPAMRANDAIDAEDARDLRDYLRAPPPGQLAAAGWIGGSVLLAVALVLQFVHHNRGDLVVHPRFGPAIASLYDVFGVEVRPNWRVDDYKIVGQARLIELTADGPDDPAANAFRLVAIIANRADRPQPPPMVRITLRDRWGDPRGVRDFAPPEYLTDRSMIDGLLEPGQRLRVVLNLRDPGAEVDGFDFDMCLPDRQGTLRCSSEPAG